MAKEKPPFLKVGDVFGRLEIVKDLGRRKKDRRKAWRCRCSCGEVIVTVKHQLVSGMTRSCGCLQREAIQKTGKARKTHGHKAGGVETPEYQAWGHLKLRCYDKGHPSFKDYGGRGIKVCEDWRESFEAFFAHVGPRPSSDHSIDRKNNDGDYEPGNVRWATRSEQARNRRTTRWITAFGRTQTMVEWVKETGFPRTAIMKRLAIGWSPEKALSVPVDSRRGYHR